MKTGRNAPCPCGSGRKYKHCCMGRKSTPMGYKLLLAGLLVVMAAALVMVVHSVRDYEPGASGRVWSEDHQHWHDAP